MVLFGLSSAKSGKKVQFGGNLSKKIFCYQSVSCENNSKSIIPVFKWFIFEKVILVK